MIILVAISAAVAVAAVFSAIHFFLRMRRLEKGEAAYFLLVSLLDKIPDLAFIKDADNDFRYIYVNNSLVRWFDFPDRSSVIGKTDSDIFPDSVAGGIRQIDTEMCRQSKSIEIYEKIPCRGKMRSCQTMRTAITLPGGRRLMVGLSRDVTELEEAQERAARHGEFLQHLLDSLPFSITAKNPDDEFRYLFWNKRMEQYTGLSAETVIGRSDDQVFPQCIGKSNVYFRELDERAIAEKEVKFEVNLPVDGQERIFESLKKMIPLPDGGRVIWQINRDITDTRRLEEERESMFERQNQTIAYQHIVNDCAGDIIMRNNLDNSINLMLRRVGEAMKADRCYIFSYSEDYLRVKYIYEWCAPGIEAQSPLLPEIPMPEQGRWTAELKAGNMVELPDVVNMPDAWKGERDVLEMQQIQSLLVQGIWLDGKLWGFVGIDFVRSKHEFSECDRQMMQSSANLFVLAREHQRQMALAADNLSLRRQIFESVSIPLVLFDLDYKIVALNPAACDTIGKPEVDVLGQKCFHALCGNDAPPEWCPMQRSVASRKPEEIEFTGHGRHYRITVQPILDRSGEPLYVLESAIDITELHDRQQELIDANAKLKEAMEQATAAMRVKSSFLATMSHEIRTPLNAIIGFSDLLQDASAEESPEYVRSINLAGNALLQLINDVLDLSKLEAGHMTISVEPSDISKLCEELMAIFSLRVKDKGLTLELICPDGLPKLCICTPRLRQVLLNLVGNAVKFTEHGGIKVKVEYNPENGDSGTLCIRVIDTGAGVKEEYRGEIFAPFIQQPHLRAASEGTGLGLSIARRLVEAMGGSLELEASSKSGSCFAVTLPNTRRA